MSAALWLGWHGIAQSAVGFIFSFHRGHRPAAVQRLVGCRTTSTSMVQDAAPVPDSARCPANSSRAVLRDGFGITLGQSPNAAGTGPASREVRPSRHCWKRRDAPRLEATHEPPGPASSPQVPTARRHLPRAAGKRSLAVQGASPC